MSHVDRPIAIETATLADPTWSAFVRLDRRFAGIDGLRVPLVRHPRLLVPIDVQALYVPAGGGEPLARVPLALRSDADAATAMFDPGTPRPPGVHLHWAMPDALVRGRAVGRAPSFPALPDRWVVLRLLAPNGATAAEVDGWIVEADTARVVPLAQWPAGAAAAVAHGPTLAAGGLTAAAGGTPLWTGFYDASFGRFGLHDPLDTIGDPTRLADGSATYLVAGWWSDPRLDPLDVAHTEHSLQSRLVQLGWSAPPGDTGDTDDRADRTRFRAAVSSLGLAVTERYALAQPAAPPTGTRLRMAAQIAIPSSARLIEGAAAAFSGEHTWPRAALLHGMVLGVPVTGPVSADGRPKPEATGVALGLHLDDVAGTFAAEVLAANAEDRRRLERTLSAFTGGLLPRIAAPDGLADLDEYEHRAGFHTRSMGTEGSDWLRTGAGGAGVTAGRQARGRAGGTRPPGPPARPPGGGKAITTVIAFAASRPKLVQAEQAVMLDQLRPSVASAIAALTSAGVQEVARPAPRAHRALDPQVAVKGAGPSLRHGHDGDASPGGRLVCRWPAQAITGIQHVVNGDQVLRSIPTSAVPDEVLGLGREALLLNPYLVPWLSDVAASTRLAGREVAFTRMRAEAVLRFGRDASYGVGAAPALAKAPAAAADRQAFAISPTITAIHEQLKRRSLYIGVEPDPMAVTSWAQPWVPMVLDWQADVTTGDRLDGWHLGEVDFEPDDGGPPAGLVRQVTGRTVVTTGAARRLALAVRDFLHAEDALEAATGGPGQVQQGDEDRLANLAAVVDRLDLVSVTLQGLRAELLGLGDVPGVEVTMVDGGGRAPALLTGGTITLRRLSLVDAFGRLLEVPVAAVAVPERELAAPATLRLRPRLNVDARWMFRLIDPGDATATPSEACVDQRPSGKPVNPVAGFVLPDHIDEALEVFDASGTPLGQLFHEAVGGGVTWEIAPGRPGPPDAGPLFDLSPGQAPVGQFAAGLVAADAGARAGSALAPGSESALSALLRAIDTTLWAIDPLASMGTEHIAGLVGRPIALVAATLRLDLQPDPGQVDPADAAAMAAWEALVATSADRAFPVQLGTLTRADDSLLGFFVDGDFSRVHLVDKAVLGAAVESGRSRGFQSAYGSVPDFPALDLLAHPYVLADDRIVVRPGQTVRLHLLMHPAGKVHLSSGVLPRKSLALARDWTAPGLSVMSPSVRVGPVLVDPAKLRLPKVNALGDTQAWTHRDTPGSWKDDPILAATQSALLPELPHEVQEGYIRVLPVQGGQ